MIDDTIIDYEIEGRFGGSITVREVPGRSDEIVLCTDDGSDVVLDREGWHELVLALSRLKPAKRDA